MNPITPIHSEASPSGLLMLPTRSYSSPLPEVTARRSDDAMFLFDARGYARFCSSPGRFSAETGESGDGITISGLIPDLPLRETTPGYNIAYVKFSFAEKPWQRHHIRMADRQLHPADICLKSIPLGHGYCLLGLVRLHEAHETPRQVAIPAHVCGTQRGAGAFRPQRRHMDHGSHAHSGQSEPLPRGDVRRVA